MFERPMQRTWSEDRGSTWRETADDVEDYRVNYLRAKTDQEIVDYAFDREENSLEEHEENDELIDEMSEVEGWDGRALPVEEIAHQTINGYHPSGWDRPLELRSLEQAAAEIERLQDENRAAWEAGDLGMGSPVEQQRAQAHAAAHRHLEEVVGIFEANHRQQLIDHQENMAINNQLLAGRAKYGEEFDDAMQELTSLDPQSVRDRSTVRTIMWGGNAAEDLMRWYSGQQTAHRGSARRAPAREEPAYEIRHGMRMSVRSRPSRQPRQDELEGYSGYGNEDVERDIADYAFAED